MPFHTNLLSYTPGQFAPDAGRVGRSLRHVIYSIVAAGALSLVALNGLCAAGEGQPYPAAGIMPQHIPPLLVGRLDAVSPRSSTLRLFVTGSRNMAATSLNIIVRGYTDLDRLTVMDGATLQRGDSIMIQGNATGADNNFRAKRIIQLAKRAPLAPGISLTATATAGAGSMQGTPVMMEGADASPTAAAPIPASPTTAPVPQGSALPTAAPVSAGANVKLPLDGKDLQRAKIEAQAEKLVRQSAKRGVLTGQIVSSAPLVMEAYDGSLWNVSLAAGGIALNQVRIPITDLRGGDSLLVKGSETGSGTFRASEIDVLPTGVPLVEARSYGRGGRRR